MRRESGDTGEPSRRLNGGPTFSPDVLRIDPAGEALAIAETIRSQVLGVLRKRGTIVALSGGIDSSVVATLCAKALGPSRVVALFMPERDTPADARRLAEVMAGRLGISLIVEDIDAALSALGCYERQREAIRVIVPEYGDGWRCKLSMPSLLDGDQIGITSLTVSDPAGRERTMRMPAAAYLQLVAATNFKQRCRKTMEYYHADRLGFAVAGTPNRLEHTLGFFVKQGDGAADIKPIAHLYKSQAYALAKHLEVPSEIRSRAPSTETFSLPQSQEEFYFRLPYREMDLCLWASNKQLAAAEVAGVLGFSVAQIERVYRDIAAKRRVGEYLHRAALTAGRETDS
jgi:NAD+ synthase